MAGEDHPNGDGLRAPQPHEHAESANGHAEDAIQAKKDELRKKEKTVGRTPDGTGRSLYLDFDDQTNSHQVKP